MSKFVFTAMFRLIITQPPLNFRFSVAHRRGKKIIVILQEDVTKEDMPLTLSDFIQNYTYLSSTDKWFWKKLLYSLPHKKGHKQNCFPCLNRSRNQSSPMSLQNM